LLLPPVKAGDAYAMTATKAIVNLSDMVISPHVGKLVPFARPDWLWAVFIPRFALHKDRQ